MALVRKRLVSHPTPEDLGRPEQGWRGRLFDVLFDSDTAAGRRFEKGLILVILASLLVIMLDSVEHISLRYGETLRVLEWCFTGLFTVEYLARLVSVKRPLRYAFSAYGIIDLLAVVPTYAAALLPNIGFLIGIRTLRLLRIFRVFKLTMFMDEYVMLGHALRASARKILVFLSVVLLVVLVMGTVMYVIEGPSNGFTNIPVSVYWAISTLATVGFGDITPHTGLGRFIASCMMLLGWGVLAVPTGIVTLEMTLAHQALTSLITTRRCTTCQTEGHEISAKHCKECGARLPEYERKSLEPG